MRHYSDQLFFLWSCFPRYHSQYHCHCHLHWSRVRDDSEFASWCFATSILKRKKLKEMWKAKLCAVSTHLQSKEGLPVFWYWRRRVDFSALLIFLPFVIWYWPVDFSALQILRPFIQILFRHTISRQYYLLLSTSTCTTTSYTNLKSASHTA